MGLRDTIRATVGRIGHSRQIDSSDRSSTKASPASDQSQANRHGNPAASKLSVAGNIADTADLWTLAWRKFQLKYTGEAESLTAYVKESQNTETTEKILSNHNVPNGLDIERAISESRERYLADHKVSASVKDAFNSIFSLLEKGSSVIGTATTCNPIAATTWAAVSLTIPILLAPGKQNEAAVATLKQTVELLHCYHSYQRLLEAEDASSKDVQYACSKVVELYTAILLFQARLIIHRGHNPAQRLISNMKDDWNETSAELTSIDRAFQAQMDALRSNWLREEQQRQQRRDDTREVNKTISGLYIENKVPKAKRLDGTCEWFFRRPEFSSWKLKQSGLLWVSADPGCGKSVLAKYLVKSRTELLDRPTDDTVIASFFFSGGRDYSNAPSAVCSLLNQILAEIPERSAVVKKHCENKGMDVDDLRYADIELLWPLFLQVASTGSRKERKIICVLDALDECDSASLNDLLEAIDDLFSNSEPIQRNIKFLVTSRPYEELRAGLRRSVQSRVDIRIDATDEQEAIKKEIDIVIGQQVEELSEMKGLNEDSKEKLREALSAMEHRTYLWLYLILERFKKEWLHAGQDIESFIKTLPPKIEDEYDRILDKSKDPAAARALLETILATSVFKPLSPDEVYLLFRMREPIERLAELSSGRTQSNADIIRDLCGLFVTIADDRVFFIHQSAREYLLAEPETREDGLVVASLVQTAGKTWRHSINMPDCHLRIGEACFRYLQLRENVEIHESSKSWDMSNSARREAVLKAMPLGAYSSFHWAKHFRQAGDEFPDHLNEAILKEVLGDEPPLLLNRHIWYPKKFRLISPCTVMAFFGLAPVLRYQHKHGVDVMATYKDEIDHLTPLNMAIQWRRVDTVRLLCLPEVLSKEHYLFSRDGQLSRANPLYTLACDIGSPRNHAMYQIVVSRPEFDFEMMAQNDERLLGVAAETGNAYIVKDLLSKGFDPCRKQPEFFTLPLQLACSAGNSEAAKAILEADPRTLDFKDENGYAPLYHALRPTRKIDRTVVTKILLAMGASVSQITDKGENILHFLNKYELLEYYLSPEATMDRSAEEKVSSLANEPDFEGDTPLIKAVKERDYGYVEILLRIPRIHIDKANKAGETAISVVPNTIKGKKILAKLETYASESKNTE